MVGLLSWKRMLREKWKGTVKTKGTVNEKGDGKQEGEGGGKGGDNHHGEGEGVVLIWEVRKEGKVMLKDMGRG